MPEQPSPVAMYLDGLPAERRAVLQQLREQILGVIPQAEEVISYNLPAFRVGRKVVVGFQANKDDYALYPFSGSAGDVFGAELDGRMVTKGSIHFTAENPIPADLLRRIVEWKLEVNAR